jgi:hypothetical protein
MVKCWYPYMVETYVVKYGPMWSNTVSLYGQRPLRPTGSQAPAVLIAQAPAVLIATGPAALSPPARRPSMGRAIHGAVPWPALGPTHRQTQVGYTTTYCDDTYTDILR